MRRRKDRGTTRQQASQDRVRVTGEALVVATPEGLYCPAGDFHIDPWRPVPRAVITHAHADHARTGSKHYWTAAPGLKLMRERLGRQAPITPLAYGEVVPFGDTRVSLHPAGHVLGSAQVRIEHAGQAWVVSGDYKRDPDPSCEPFEPLRCDTFITEATFALPAYRWAPPRETTREIAAWWQAAREADQAAVLFCYSLGKAQRVLAELAALAEDECEPLRPARDAVVGVHGAMPALIKAYRDAGVAMLATESVVNARKGTSFAGRLILAPPGAGGTPWMRRFAPYTTGFASGWMHVNDTRRQRYHRGFALSDHADWNSLLRTISETGARRVLVTHGHGDALIAHLRGLGLDAAMLHTRFEGETGGAAEEPASEAAT
jgi:putative mRNA 3-end processing factor